MSQDDFTHIAAKIIRYNFPNLSEPEKAEERDSLAYALWQTADARVKAIEAM